MSARLADVTLTSQRASGAMRVRARIKGMLMILGALLAAILAITALVSLLGGSQSTEPGVIYGAGQQIVRVRSGAGYTTTQIPYVVVRLNDGTVHQIESVPLYNLWRANRRDLKVEVRLDVNGDPKAVRFQGQWYGAGPPAWFWILFVSVLLLLALGLFRGGFRSLRVRPPATDASAAG